MSKYLAIALAFCLAACNNAPTNMADMEVDLDNEDQKLSYALGVNIGSNLKKQGLDEIDPAILAKGVAESITDSEAKMNEEEAVKFLSEYFQSLRTKDLDKHLKEGQEFLAENKKKDGVITLESGLQYEVIKEGSGPKPKDTDKVTTHYHGTLIDGTVFDSSVDRGEPATFPVNGVIKGWTEALQLMPVGSKWRLFIPTELAYGQNPRPNGVIKPNMALIFEVELLKIEE